MSYGYGGVGLETKAVQAAQTEAEYQRMNGRLGDGPADAPTPERPIAVAMQRAHGEMTQLHMAIEELERRLDPVCRPLPPSGEAAGKNEVQAVRSQAHVAIESLGQGARFAQRRARVDRVVTVTRPVALDVDWQTARLVATRHGLVLVQREAGWTWYRWGMAGQWWSVTVPVERTPGQAEREAARLIHACRERYRR